MDRNLLVVLLSAMRGVALRKESVDRNNNKLDTIIESIQSLSARRAWIEITGTMGKSNRAISRSPQGERG